MDFWSVFFFSLFLLICAAGLMASHVRTWRRFQQRREQLNPREFDYRRRQFRRRMQSTAMLAILAVALLAGHWITADRVRPLVFSVYWGSVLLVVLWVGLLAVVALGSAVLDVLAVRHGPTDWLAWSALGVTAAALAVRCWDRQDRFAPAGLYLAGLTAVGMGLTARELGMRTLCLAAGLELAAFALGVALVAEMAVRLTPLARLLRLPHDRQPRDI